MKKFLLFAIAFSVLNLCVFAQSFDFSQNGNSEADAILKDYIQNEIENFHGDTTAYFYDIDNDGQNEIIGIVKSKLFYNLEGYNLVLLKNIENNWQRIQTNVNFDELQPFDITGNKITYHKSVFYKHKKYYATIKNGNIHNADSMKDLYKDKKIKSIERTVDIVEGQPKIEIDVNDIPCEVQRAVKIEYHNLSGRTKHYLDMK